MPEVDQLVTEHITHTRDAWSTSLIAAWQVVGFLQRSRGLDLVLTSSGSDSWTAEFRVGGLAGGSAWAPTAPLAICRAALAAVDAS